jgi:hypothetical protein
VTFANTRVAEADATSPRRVILGSADAHALRWGQGTKLNDDIEWSGVCIPPVGGSGMPSLAPCSPTAHGSVIDTTTGAFVVGGG